jgi:ferric-dicitrate binding protein FerR (iron transport regulator)
MGVKNRVWILMGKKLSGSLTHDEEQEMDELFQAYPDVWYTYEILNSLDEKENIPQGFINEIETLLKYDEIHTADKVDHTVLNKAKVSPIWLKVGIAAVVLVSFSWIVILGYKYFNNTSKAVSDTNEIVVQKGTKTDVTLPDGSRIILNSGSKLTYAKNYASADVREVTLSGEAYFKIVHDQQHPFIIHTTHFDIRDIGTTFNVNAYPGEKNSEASLIEGAIEIALKTNGAQKILLKPHQKASLINSNGDYKITALNAVNGNKSEFAETAWINNELIFKNEAFEDLAKQMERRYNVEITFGDEKIKKAYLTGIFKNESIDLVLKELQLITPFKYQINRDKINIQSL